MPDDNFDFFDPDALNRLTIQRVTTIASMVDKLMGDTDEGHLPNDISSWATALIGVAGNLFGIIVAQLGLDDAEIAKMGDHAMYNFTQGIEQGRDSFRSEVKH